MEPLLSSGEHILIDEPEGAHGVADLRNLGRLRAAREADQARAALRPAPRGSQTGPLEYDPLRPVEPPGEAGRRLRGYLDVVASRAGAVILDVSLKDDDGDETMRRCSKVTQKQFRHAPSRDWRSIRFGRVP